MKNQYVNILEAIDSIKKKKTHQTNKKYLHYSYLTGLLSFETYRAKYFLFFFFFIKSIADPHIFTGIWLMNLFISI